MPPAEMCLLCVKRTLGCWRLQESLANRMGCCGTCASRLCRYKIIDMHTHNPPDPHSPVCPHNVIHVWHLRCRWLEEWSVRLQAGWYRSLEGEACAASLAEAGISTRGAISLFPRSFPAAATAITRGVQVRFCASSLCTGLAAATA
jgi:hypothetical protein